MTKIVFVPIYVMAVLQGCSGSLFHKETFTNPVAPHGADPWVLYHEGKYYYSYSLHDKIWINQSENLLDAVQQKGKAVWEPPAGEPYSHGLWAPEIHFLNGSWYIYVAADDGRNENHRMYVLQRNAASPVGPYVVRGKIADPSDKWAIDGTVMRYNGTMFFIWSGWEGDDNLCQNLYIAPMSDPATINGQRVLISTPEFDWEKVGRPMVNEGPEVLEKNGKVFIIYSASGSWTDSYSLGQLTLIGDDPLNPAAWKKKNIPVFSGTSSVISPGHASFTKTPDGEEDWIVYHAAQHPGAGWDRNIRLQRFGWDADGHPVFGKPVSPREELSFPSQK